MNGSDSDDIDEALKGDPKLQHLQQKCQLLTIDNCRSDKKGRNLTAVTFPFPFILLGRQWLQTAARQTQLKLHPAAAAIVE